MNETYAGKAPSTATAQAARTVADGMRLTTGFKSETPGTPGRRTFLTYSDLGAKKASNGRMRANKVTSVANMVEPTGWHYHLCEMQFVYFIRGETVLEFEDGTVGTFRAGDAVSIPGGVRHNEIRLSDDVELIEVVVPGEIGTVACDRPEGLPATLKPISSKG